MNQLPNGLLDPQGLVAMDVGSDPDGYRRLPQRRLRSAAHRTRLAESLNTLANLDGLNDHELSMLIAEAATTADFPLTLADILDRRIRSGYADTPPVMGNVVTRNPNASSMKHNVTIDQIQGGDERLQKVPELGQYTAVKPTEAEITYKLAKWGRIAGFSWEQLVSDRFRIMTAQPDRFGRAARKTEEWFLTNLFMDSAGARDTYFTGNGGQSSVSNLALTAANLKTAYSEMIARTAPITGDPIVSIPRYLMVPPALALTAQEILASDLRITGSDTIIPAINIVSRVGLQLLVNPWIPIIVTTGTLGSTSWFLFTDPNDIPAGEIGHLNGRTEPEIFLKASGQLRVGGGDVDPLEGDWLTDRIDYKVRHVFGGTTVDGRAGWASDGQ